MCCLLYVGEQSWCTVISLKKYWCDILQHCKRDIVFQSCFQSLNLDEFLGLPIDKTFPHIHIVNNGYVDSMLLIDVEPYMGFHFVVWSGYSLGELFRCACYQLGSGASSSARNGKFRVWKFGLPVIGEYEGDDCNCLNA